MPELSPISTEDGGDTPDSRPAHSPKVKHESWRGQWPSGPLQEPERGAAVKQERGAVKHEQRSRDLTATERGAVFPLFLEAKDPGHKGPIPRMDLTGSRVVPWMNLVNVNP